MKKILIAIFCGVIVLFAVYFIGTGFVTCGSVFIEEFEVSDDGNEMSLKTGVGSSMGFTRSVSVKEGDNGELYLHFYSGFGGLNGSVGAKNHFVIELEEDSKEIFIFRSGGEYTKALEKNESGEWQRAS